MHAHRFLLYDAGTSATFEAMAVCAFGERKRDSFSFFFFERETSDFFFVSSSPTSKCFFFFFHHRPKKNSCYTHCSCKSSKTKKSKGKNVCIVSKKEWEE